MRTWTDKDVETKTDYMLKDELNALEYRCHGAEATLAQLTLKLSAMAKHPDAASIEQLRTDMASEVIKLDCRFENVGEQTSEHAERITALESLHVDLTQRHHVVDVLRNADSHEQRIVALEKAQGGLRNDVDALCEGKYLAKWAAQVYPDAGTASPAPEKPLVGQLLDAMHMTPRTYSEEIMDPPSQKPHIAVPNPSITMSTGHEFKYVEHPTLDDVCAKIDALAAKVEEHERFTVEHFHRPSMPLPPPPTVTAPPQPTRPMETKP
jgi:hypothetical protein